jgi:hypothetical protein
VPTNTPLFDLYFTGEYEKIPAHMRDALTRYVVDRVAPGNFLQAVIRNDLRDACGRADADNLLLLPTYVKWFYNVAPGRCWGSPENYKAWLAGE